MHDHFQQSECIDFDLLEIVFAMLSERVYLLSFPRTARMLRVLEVEKILFNDDLILHLPALLRHIFVLL